MWKHWLDGTALKPCQEGNNSNESVDKDEDNEDENSDEEAECVITFADDKTIPHIL